MSWCVTFFLNVGVLLLLYVFIINKSFLTKTASLEHIFDFEFWGISED